jgi:hypothetical protein
MPQNQIDISTDLISVAVVKIDGYPSSSCRRVVVVVSSCCRRRVVVVVSSSSCCSPSLDRGVVVVSFVVSN